MKVPVSWLREFVDLNRDGVDLSTNELATVFNSLGLVVEGVETLGQLPAGVITARVLATRPHPNADKIQLVDVAIGDGEALQICCGAFNMKAGDIVPLATVGTTLDGGRQIERRKLRGEWSNGMLCSASELGVGHDHAGIWVLDQDTPLGLPLAEALGLQPDAIFDLAIEANRPDAMGVLGIARDLAAKIGRPLRNPPVRSGVVDRQAPSISRGAIDHHAADSLCDRLTVTVIRNVVVGQSPDRVQNRLIAAGMRPINNLVDASNYVMLELGIPNHAFDLDKLPGGRIGVRWAAPGEQVETLDGVVRTLSTEGSTDGVIVDGDDNATGIAAIMGGAASEVDGSTTAILLEIAHWTPMAIARSSKRLGLRSEASARFERGTDPDAIPLAVSRFLEIVGLTCPGAVVESFEDVRPSGPLTPRLLLLRSARLNLVLGTDLDDDTIGAYLRPLGFGCRLLERGHHEVEVPSWRPDCDGEVNLIEEVGRHHGYDRIPRQRLTNDSVGHLTTTQHLRRRLRRHLVGLGVSEAWTATLIAQADIDRAGLPVVAIELANPMAREEGVLRPALLPGLLRALSFNANHRQPAIRLFEIGHVFGHPRPGQVLPYEREHVAVVLAADGDDAAQAKRVLDAIVAQLGVNPAAVGLEVPPRDRPVHGLHPTRCARVIGTGTNVPFGVVGEIDPSILEAWGMDPSRRVGWLQFDLDNLLGLPRRSLEMRSWSRFPSSDVDLAFSVPDGSPAAAVAAALRQAGGELLQQAELFDVYRGPGIARGNRSLAYRLRFCALDRTLTDAEIATARQRCIDAVSAGVPGAQLRN